MDNQPEVDFTRHTGKPVLVKFIGGEWHGEIKRLRRPLTQATSVARPPKYLGNNFYEASPGAIEYDTYFLRQDGPDVFYVHESIVDGFPANKNMHYETRNARKMKEERASGGPRDLVEEGIIGHSPEMIERLSEVSEYKVGDEYPKFVKKSVSEEELAKADFEKYGIAIMVDGKRVEPKRVRLLVNIKNPLSITLKDLLANRT